MERDFGIRFSDEVYASKDEVKKALQISSIDSIWERINQYRSYFKKNLDLVSIERKVFSVCLTSTIQQRVMSLEKKLTKMMVNFNRLDSNMRNEFIYNSLLRVARSYADENSLRISDYDLRELIVSQTLEIPQEYLSLKNYISILQFYLFRTANKFDLNILTSFYGRILRKEINPDNYESYVRIIDLNNPSDHVVFGRHYNAAPLDRIEELLTDLVKFNDRNYVLSIIKSIITYYYLIYIKPFDYFNEECALLSLKYIIAHDDLDTIPLLLNLENKLLNINDELFSKKFILSELTNDLTYFVNYILDILEEEICEFLEIMHVDEIRQIKQEFTQIDIKKDNDSIENTNSEVNFIPNNPIVFEQKVSMPTLPVGLDAKDVDLIAENLLELYPSLKRYQAQFYASHCTIGKYYSIAQYKKEMKVAYETARTSMDNLVLLGFYKKEQIKNKFVYTPVVR